MPSKLVFLCCLVSVVLADNPEELLFRRTMEQCLNSDSTYTCLANKAAKAVERALDWDVPIFEGITLARNEEKLDNYTTPRSYDGISRLTSVLSKFLESHKLVVDLTPEEEDVGSARKDEGGLGFGGDKKGKKKEKKYASYAMMVMMGIFGLTGPLVLKALALIAGKALIASKMALLIVGSVALKKLFEKESHTPSVKVRTVQEEHHHDDHDRLLYNYNMNNYNSNAAYNSNNTPYNYAKMSR